MMDRFREAEEENGVVVWPQSESFPYLEGSLVTNTLCISRNRSIYIDGRQLLNIQSKLILYPFVPLFFGYARSLCPALIHSLVLFFIYIKIKLIGWNWEEE